MESERKPAFGLSRDPWGRLVLIDAEGVRHVGVEPVRAFPISDPERWVALCDADGREIATVGALSDLPAATRQILEEELAQREFVPVIRRILSATSDSAPVDWDIETDRGRTRISLSGDDDVRRLGPHGCLITDSRGLRYLIRDMTALDATSRRILDNYL